MSIFARIKAFFAALNTDIDFDTFVADAVQSFKPLPILPTIPEPKLVAVKGRDRSPNKHRAYRRAHGIPHGTSGAKLARRAAAGRIGI